MAGNRGFVDSATTRLLKTAAALDADAVRASSLLPGWTRGHVLTHLSRNADAQLRMINAALEGHTAEQYPGGPAGRAAEISTGAARSAAEIVDDLMSSCRALVARWDSLPDNAWDLSTTPLAGRRYIRDGITARWREVEVHHVDLAAGYRPADWPTEFVDAFLPRTIIGLPRRARDVPPGHRWRLHDRTHGTTWHVTATAVSAEALPCDTEVVADAPHLLAWLLGRGADGVRVHPTDGPDLLTLVPFG